MRLGIDFGTTRTIVALVDRGNYPVLDVEDADGQVHDHIPTQLAFDGDRIVCGWDVPQAAGVPLRSFKRLLAEPGTTAATAVTIGDRTLPLGEVLGAFAQHVVAQVRANPLVRSYEQAYDAELEAVIGVPASASSAQRLLTFDAFTRAGVHVLAIVNEPSAAAFEYSHRHARTLNSKRTDVLVYDLGGGTFDASLVRISGPEHRVIATAGNPRLGGDDFDEVLLRLALSGAGIPETALTVRELAGLREQARQAKERLTPQTRRMHLERDDADLTVPVAEFYEAVTPLVEQTIAELARVFHPDEQADLAESGVAGIYLVGGASGLPLVPRLLKERFGRRVHRSPYPAASGAIGLAIAADPRSKYWLRERTARGIGVFREWRGGLDVNFDVLIPAGECSDDANATRQYRAAHNIGWFRFVEFPGIAGELGDLTTLAEVVVPFEQSLVGADLSRVPVERREAGPLVRESVRVDDNGIARISVEVPELGVRIERTVTIN